MEKKIFAFTGGKSNDLSKKWYVYYFDQNGKMQKSYKGLHTHKKLSDRLAAVEQLKEELQNEVFVEGPQPEKKGLAKLIEEYVNNHPTKRVGYRTSLRCRLKPLIEYVTNNRVVNFTKEDARKYKVYLLSKGKEGDLKGIISMARLALKRITGNKINPFEDIEIARVTHTPAKYFQVKQIDKVKNHVMLNNPELWLFIEFMFYCFIRPIEIAKLKVADILIDEDKIVVRSDISKNKKTQYVWIPSAFKQSLLDSGVLQKKESDYVFYRKPKTQPHSISTRYSCIHKKVLQELGISNEHSLYSWKHTGAVMCVKAGIKVKWLQIQLRHSTLAQTDQYLRQMGMNDNEEIKNLFPSL